MYRKKVEHSIYGTFYVEEESFLEFHRTLAGLSALESVAEKFAEHGVGPEDMEPAFFKTQSNGEEIVFYKILDQNSPKEMTLGVTYDEDRFPLFPRDDGFWKPGRSRPRPGADASAQENSSSANSQPSGTGDAERTSGPHPKLRISPDRSKEAEMIQQIKNARKQFATNLLSEEHQTAIWRHTQLIRADDPENALTEALEAIGANDLNITYKSAATILKFLENPSAPENIRAGSEDAGGPDGSPGSRDESSRDEINREDGSRTESSQDHGEHEADASTETADEGSEDEGSENEDSTLEPNDELPY